MYIQRLSIVLTDIYDIINHVSRNTLWEFSTKEQFIKVKRNAHFTENFCFQMNWTGVNSFWNNNSHMSVIAFPINGNSTVYSTASSDLQQINLNSASLALCDGNPPVTGGFPSQRASNAAWYHAHSPVVGGLEMGHSAGQIGQHANLGWSVLDEEEAGLL